MIGISDRHAAMLFEVPSKVSGTQPEKGTSPMLKVNPNIVKMQPILNKGEVIEVSLNKE